MKDTISKTEEQCHQKGLPHRVVVVLGMHRSGTSALAKSLDVLGVSLSENLMPEGEFNPKGHWEDLDVVDINERLLAHLGLSWFSPKPYTLDFNDPAILSLTREAMDLVTARVEAFSLWGFKDPRTSYLLPFWQHVFNQMDMSVKWVFIHRNPLDIARSLNKRDNFSHRHSYLLWLYYTAYSLEQVNLDSICWVSFSQLLDQPRDVLEKMASAIDIPLPDEKAISSYCEQFIDSSLNHSHATNQDLNDDSECFFPVSEWHSLFTSLSESDSLENNIEFGDDYVSQLNEVLSQKQELCNEIESRVRLQYRYNEQEAQLYHSQLRCQQVEDDSRNHLAERDIAISELTDELKGTHNKLSEALQNLAERDTAVNELTNELKGAHSKLSEALQSLDAEHNNFLHVRSQLEAKDVEYQFKSAQYESCLEKMQQQEQHLVHLNGEIEALRHALAAVYQSTSWKATLPLRFVKDIPRNIRRANQFATQRGGYAKCFKKAYRIWREKGLDGLRNRAIAHVENAIDYGRWLERYGSPSIDEKHAILQRIGSLSQPPVISILMPVYNTPEEYLREAIESVIGQLYPHWELCIADDASPDKHVIDVIKEYQAKDSRIKFVARESNGHISATTNSALAIASGDYIALMDHDDRLAVDALYWVAENTLSHDNAALIYSDEDKITADGHTRYDPNFKPEWNPTLFLSQNYISHLGVYRADIAKQIGGFRVGFEGAQDWDFALRFIEQIDSDQIVHIPRVLYHWRAIEGSTAVDGDEKPYALIAGLKAVEEHLARVKCNATVETHPERHYVRVKYDIPTPAPLVSIVIPTKNGLDVLSVCIESILKKTTYPNFEIIIIDNGSDDPETLDYLQRMSDQDVRVRVIRDDSPFNYSALNNNAVKHAAGELIALVNNDIEVITPDWLTEMVGHAIQPQNGAVGARLWYPDNTLQHGGVILVGGVAGHAHKYLPKGMPGYSCRAIVAQNFSAVTAACLVIRKSVFNEVSGLNAKDLSVAFNDVDFCLKVQQAGYHNVWTPFAELYHYESKTRGQEDTPEKIARFQTEIAYMQNHWGTLLLNDPCYNPNLTLAREDFSLAEERRV